MGCLFRAHTARRRRGLLFQATKQPKLPNLFFCPNFANFIYLEFSWTFYKDIGFRQLAGIPCNCGKFLEDFDDKLQIVKFQRHFAKHQENSPDLWELIWKNARIEFRFMLKRVNLLKLERCCKKLNEQFVATILFDTDKNGLSKNWATKLGN